MREEIRINGVYLKATANEVCEIDYSDLKESDEVCSPKEFLKALQNGESAIAFFDGSSEELYDEIEKNYGIN